VGSLRGKSHPKRFAHAETHAFVLTITKIEMISFPTELPALELLSNAEVSALRSALQVGAKEARERSNKLLSKTPALAMLWTKSLSKNLSPEERDTVERSLHLALMRQPKAFAAYTTANMLTQFASIVMKASLERSALEVKK
jgi:hypothetical protein